MSHLENRVTSTAKDKIIQTFDKLRQEYQSREAKITTKEEEVEKKQ